MSFEKRTVRLKCGQSMPLVYHAQPYRPVKLPTLFLLEYGNQQTGTLDKAASLLQWLYQWGDLCGIDIERRLCAGETLARREIIAFGRWLRLGRQAPNLVGAISPEQIEAIIREPVKVDANRPNRVISNTPVPFILGADTWNGYMGILHQFLLWALGFYLPGVSNETTVNEAFASAVTYLRQQFSRLTIKVRDAPDPKGLTPEQKKWLLNAALPGSKNNPFQPNVQLRNYILVWFLLYGGIRRGEALCLRVTDYPRAANGYKLQIVRREEDNLDLRKKRPRVKTLGRDIPMPVGIARHCEAYVDKYHWVHRISQRTGKPRKSRPTHPFFFVSSQGGCAPLTLDALNAVFEKLKATVFPDGSVDLTPRVLRNTFCNETMADLVDMQRMPVETAMERLRYLCGWAPASEMPLLYAQKWLQASADAAILKRLCREYEKDMNE